MNPVQILQHIYPAREARAIYRMVMELRFGLSQADILMDKDKDLSAENLTELQNIMHRLANGEPVQYILRLAEFCGHKFCVEPGVLVPRPETAELVNAVKSEPPGCTVLDIGTGSGCIAVTLALAGYRVTAIDISEQALSIARRNAEDMDADIEFVHENILQPKIKDRQWDILVSNPPYICRSEAEDMHLNVLQHEPHLALFVPDEDPLLFYKAIAEFGRTHLCPGGRIYLEINRRFGMQICNLLKDKGYHNICLLDDQFLNPRFIICTLPL